MIAPLFAAALLLLPGAQALAPSVSADLDGDGRAETATVSPARGSARLEVRDAAGRKLADAKAPSPGADVVPLTVTSLPLGSAGALVEIVAATDVTECRTFWRFRDGALTKLPLVGAGGKPLPDCAPPGGWSERWDAEGGGRSAAWVRERSETSAGGPFVTREAYAFAGFSLDYDRARSGSEVAGVPIPAWYGAILYPRDALEILYARFGLARMRQEPTLVIDADGARGVFALRLASARGELVLPVDTYARTGRVATLGARSGAQSAQAEVRLGGDGSVPLTVVVTGLGPDWDRSYSPAGAWRGGARQVFPSAADELASEGLPGSWSGTGGKTRLIEADAGPPYRVRLGGAEYRLTLPGAAPAPAPAPVFDALLRPSGAQPGAAWGLVLRGPNTLDLVPLACEAGGADSPCRPDGPAETLRRIGARINVQ